MKTISSIDYFIYYNKLISQPNLNRAFRFFPHDRPFLNLYALDRFFPDQIIGLNYFDRNHKFYLKFVLKCNFI